MIPFNKPPLTGNEEEYILEAMKSAKISGDGDFTKRCEARLERMTGAAKVLLTPSCTQALEMAAILLDIEPGDEIIMPSYTFVSSANAFVLRGAKIVFVDIRPDTMNVDEKHIEAAITPKTKAILPVHYAGVACDMDTIMEIAARHDLFVIEDAAQGMMATYKGKMLGSIGHLGAYSFHETKNYTSGGEGGLLLINDERFQERAEIIREKGTNRSSFFRGMVEKYSWVDIGSSYLLSELQAAYLWGQLEHADYIHQNRLQTWQYYFESFHGLAQKEIIELPVVPDQCQHNGHMFYLKVQNIDVRTKLLQYLKANGILAIFHYVPLHSSVAGVQYSRFSGVDKFTTLESERLIRLPLFYGITQEQTDRVINCIRRFFQ